MFKKSIILLGLISGLSLSTNANAVSLDSVHCKNGDPGSILVYLTGTFWDSAWGEKVFINVHDKSGSEVCYVEHLIAVGRKSYNCSSDVAFNLDYTYTITTSDDDIDFASNKCDGSLIQSVMIEVPNIN